MKWDVLVVKDVLVVNKFIKTNKTKKCDFSHFLFVLLSVVEFND